MTRLIEARQEVRTHDRRRDKSEVDLLPDVRQREV